MSINIKYVLGRFIYTHEAMCLRELLLYIFMRQYYLRVCSTKLLFLVFSVLLVHDISFNAFVYIWVYIHMEDIFKIYYILINFHSKSDGS